METFSKKIIMAISILTVLLASSFSLDANPVTIIFQEDTILASHVVHENNPRLTLSISETNHFFTKGTTVEITATNPNATIFYTTDGTVPTIDSDEYDEPLYFGLCSEIYAIVLRVIGIYEEYTTEPITHTYFIGQGIQERFASDILVFSLSANPEYLFDNDIGILVKGRLREEFIRDNPDVETIHWSAPANYHMRGVEAERSVHVETFTKYGERVLSQAAGLRVHGGATRIMPQKSLRLIARRQYSPEAGRFHLDFFPNDVANNGLPIIRNDSLTLRSGGNDQWRGMLRNELGSSLARMAGLVSMPFRPAAVFLNGEYYGFTWLQVHISTQYLADAFNAPTREFDIVSGGEKRFNIGHRNIDENAIADLEFKNSFTYKNMLDDHIFAEFEAIVDIDNLLLYYAFQIFWNNCDWPGNNLRRWRYSGEQTSDLAPELDGRWRYAVYDLDFGLGSYHPSSDDELFQRMLEGENPRSPFLVNILTRPDLAEKFTMILCDIAANVINGQIVEQSIDTLFGESVWNEINHWAVHRDKDIDVIESQHRKMIEMATYRHQYIFESLSQFFGFDNEMYTVKVFGGEAIIGTQRGTSSRYFNHLIIPVSPIPPEFTEFDHWLLNGEQIYDPNINVSLADANDGVVELELITRSVMPPLVIKKAHTSPQGNGMILVNLTDETIRSQGLFLSNNSNYPNMWRMPVAVIRPGETLELAGRGSRLPGDSFRIRMGFNVREGRLLILSDENGNVLDTFAFRTGEQMRGK